MSNQFLTFTAPQEMITVNAALAAIRQHLPPRQVVTVPLLQAVDAVLARTVIATEPSPRYTNSAMDGYAVRFADVREASPENPITLRVIGESQAGLPFTGRVGPGTAVTISTGAMLPEGADTVVPVEDVQLQRDHITITQTVKPKQHVRFQGEEFQEGTELIAEGTLINPTHIALMAALGQVDVPVYAPLRVAILVTGSELVPPYEDPQPHQIRESNGVMLQAAVSRSGGLVVYRKIVADDPQQTLQALHEAMEQADVIVFSGGVSMGPHDHVKSATLQAGFTPVFWRVKQKPGKPLFFATREGQMVFGLPGNPVSAFMTYTYYVHPVLQYARGLPFDWPKQQITLQKPLTNPLKRAHFMRLRLFLQGEKWFGEPLTKQGSHMLTTVAHAGGFVKLEVGEHHAAGETIEVFLFP